MVTAQDQRGRGIHRDLLQDGRYELGVCIGKGGMGSVFRGRQVELDRPVAIKLLHPHLADSQDKVDRFRREARAAKLLSHPNTIRLLDFGTRDTGEPYLVLEYLEGQSLDLILGDSGPLQLDRVKHVGIQVLKSLTEAHHHGVVHRDIKPSNLMLCDQVGEIDFIKVLDFGVARMDGAQLTSTGALVGTPQYMAPEQALGRKVDGRCDLYSLAITLYELATGRPPYFGSQPLAVAMKHTLPGRIPMPRWLEATGLGEVLRKALEKDPDDRYQSAEEMLGELRLVRTASIEAVAVAATLEAGPETAPRWTRPHWSSRHTITTALVACGVLVAIGFAGAGSSTVSPAETTSPTLSPPVVSALGPQVEVRLLAPEIAVDAPIDEAVATDSAPTRRDLERGSSRERTSSRQTRPQTVPRPQPAREDSSPPAPTLDPPPSSDEPLPALGTPTFF